MIDWTAYFAFQARQIELAFEAQYDLGLVIASVAIACLASYAVFRIAGCASLTDAASRTFAWRLSGALTMGIGIWSMHFVGMLAFRLPVAVGYDLGLTIASVVPAVLASGLMLVVLTSPRPRFLKTVGGGTAIGLGIAAMHYIGMAAMQFDGSILHEPFLFAVSVVVSVLLAVVALHVKLHMRVGKTTIIVPAAVLAAAISTMHYTAMSAALCLPGTTGEGADNAADPVLLSALIIVAAVLLIGFTIFVTVVDRRLHAATSAARVSRTRLLDILESASDGFAFFGPQDRLELCNAQFHRLIFGDEQERIALGTPFETIIRQTAERGLIRLDNGNVEAFVRERVGQHRSPQDPVLQHRGDGRWLLISETRTPEGGTVAIYSDVTELKKKEEELARKTNALEQLSRQLSKYLSPQVYNSIFSGRTDVRVASKRKKLTVFFSDLVDFTEATDRLESEELTQALNRYLTEMSEIALRHAATIDKYVGDAIVIFFGDPESQGAKQDALACVEMAIAMRDRIEALQHIWRDAGIEKPFQARIGIHTDYCTVGNFGSDDRLDYTVVGRGVNLAARLQAAAPPGEILISYETFAQVRDAIACEEHGEVSAKGLAYPIKTYRVLGAALQRDTGRNTLRQETEHVSLDLDLDRMNSAQKERVARLLREALRFIDPK